MKTHQKDFILKYFFENDKFAGWRNIATELIDKETVLTTCDHRDIWSGGIGNFIKSCKSDEGIGLWRYSFNVKEFLSSSWFKEIKGYYLEDIKEQYEDIKDKKKQIEEL